MNGTTKQRYISTSIWSDDWFDSLSEREKLVYFYLLTNEHSNAAGVYQCTLKNVRLEMGLNRDDIEVIMEKFAAAGKAFYYKEYIIIPKWLKHQKIKERSGLFLGAVKVLKSLPEEIKTFISDRRHYDYDVSEIIGKVSRPSKDPPKTLPPENRDPPPANDTPSQDPPQKTGRPSQVPPPQTTAQTAHDLDLDSDLDLDHEFNINTHSEKTETLSKHFIHQWQQNADVFNCLARLKKPNDWQAFWEQNTMTLEQINLAFTNFIEGVKTGAIERRFIPGSPDTFVLNGWLSKSQTPFKKPGQHIANDNVSEDDVAKYFRRM